MADRQSIQRKITEARSKLQYAENVLRRCVVTPEEDVFDFVENSCKKSNELINRALAEIYKRKKE